MVEVLGITYTMKVYWEVSINPFEVKLLANDADVLEMVSNLPRNHYFHVYLEDVNSANSANRVDGDPGSEDSDLEDSDYDKSDFTDFENDYEDEVSDVGVGVNVDSGNVEGSDEVRFDSDADSERSDSLHSPDGSDADGPHKKYRYPEFNTTAAILNPTFKYLDAFHSDPNYSTRSLKQAIFKDFSIYVHLSKCIRVKNLALARMHGNLNEQYTKLYDYLAELRSSNPGTTTILQLDESVFKRLYICMQAMKDSFKAGCRPIICMDGCHLKGYYKGHLLATVGLDADDCLYPLAFAIVDKHRTCVRHLFNNFKLAGDHKGKALKDQLWKAGRDTYVREFEVAMAELEGLSSIGNLFLSRKDPRPETYVDPCYSVSTQMAIYSHFISPVRGENQWTPQQTNLVVLPPIIRRPPGRPNKSRRRQPDEAPPQGGMMAKKGVRMSCKTCGGYGHNVRTCKGPVGGNTRPQQRASSSTERRAPRPKLPIRINQGQAPTQPPPPVHIVRWMPTPTFPSSRESSVSQSSTPTAPAQKKSMNDP
ncbi:hypothetical protein V6N13_088691 [Hibiscus sabdariffa]